jgi:hypothetical protein
MSQAHNTNKEFHEEQQFRQPWLWILLLVLAVCITVVFVQGFYTQLYLGLPWGERPMSDTALLITGTLSIVFTAGFGWLFYQLKLVTEVDSDGIHIRFFPLTRKHIRFEDISSCEVRIYRPIREYGGWGIRFSRKGRALNVSGNRGVQLEFLQGMPLLIGSQQADDLARAIKAHL